MTLAQVKRMFPHGVWARDEAWYPMGPDGPHYMARFSLLTPTGMYVLDPAQIVKRAKTCPKLRSLIPGEGVEEK